MYFLETLRQSGNPQAERLSGNYFILAISFPPLEWFFSGGIGSALLQSILMGEIVRSGQLNP
jgi:hypothetical protein